MCRIHVHCDVTQSMCGKWENMRALLCISYYQKTVLDDSPHFSVWSFCKLHPLTSRIRIQHFPKTWILVCHFFIFFPSQVSAPSLPPLLPRRPWAASPDLSGATRRRRRHRGSAHRSPNCPAVTRTRLQWPPRRERCRRFATSSPWKIDETIWNMMKIDDHWA